MFWENTRFLDNPTIQTSSCVFSVYPRNKKGHGNFKKKGTLSAPGDQKGHSKRALSDQKGHINLVISVEALLA